MELYHGDILFAKDRCTLASYEDSYLCVEDGKVKGIYEKFPEELKNAPLIDFGRGVIIPAFSDLHVHASQYIQRGVGMDLLLSDWLNQYTFPQEARFKDLSYAEPIYTAFVEDLIRHGTLHASLFATIHRDATNVLYKKLEEKGLYALVGKVNMDRNSPSYLCETVAESILETEKYLDEHVGSAKVRPILTPRFAPTCSRESLAGLGKLGQKYQVGLQTHLVESLWEAQEARNLFPECGSDAEIYERAGLLGNGPSIFAHVIFPTEEDKRIIRKYDAVSVHCPDATNNIIAGIMPVNRLQEEGLKIALGCDVGGGHGIPVYKQVSRAVQLSKLKEFYEPDSNKSITFTDAFHAATRVGGSVFGKVGAFEEGYQFNALVIDNMEDAGIPMTPAQRIERFCYIGDDRNIVARFIDGKSV